MEVDSLYLLVSEAIHEADSFSDLGAPGAASASIDVSMLEEKIAEQVPTMTPEGALARRGAVRAAAAAGDVERAARLIERFCSDADASDELRDDLRAMLPTPSAALSRRR